METSIFWEREEWYLIYKVCLWITSVSRELQGCLVTPDYNENTHTHTFLITTHTQQLHLSWLTTQDYNNNYTLLLKITDLSPFIKSQCFHHFTSTIAFTLINNWYVFEILSQDNATVPEKPSLCRFFILP